MLSELLRIAERAIVSLPNFGHWRVRLDLLSQGRMPVTHALPEPWWATPNIHLCTVRDFTQLCDELGLRIEACAALANGKPARPIDPTRAQRELARGVGALPAEPRRNASGYASAGGRQVRPVRLTQFFERVAPAAARAFDRRAARS